MGEKGIITDGLHYLSGFDYHTFNKYDGEMIEGYVIVLDGKKYLIYTDPDDGYRSYNVVGQSPPTVIISSMAKYVKNYF